MYLLNFLLQSDNKVILISFSGMPIFHSGIVDESVHDIPSKSLSKSLLKHESNFNIVSIKDYSS